MSSDFTQGKEIECPWCKSEWCDSDVATENKGSGIENCENCGKRFRWEANYSVEFTCFKMKQKEGKKAMKTPEERIQEALRLASDYAGFDGSHHKQWVIDRMVNVLLGGTIGHDCDEYKAWVEKYNSDEDYTDWDEGIAP